MMTPWQRRGLILLLLSSCIGCDQFTKDLAQDTLPHSGPISLANDTVRRLYAENPGVAFSLGARLSATTRFWIFSVVVGLFLAGLLAFVFISVHPTSAELVGYSLVIGGGISNVLDRFLNDGHVIDFMVLRLGSLKTAIFNFADVVILLGLAVLIITSWRNARKVRPPVPPTAPPPVPSAEAP
jgi:signal peptidase II